MLYDPTFYYTIYNNVGPAGPTASDDPDDAILWGSTKMVEFTTDILGGFMDCNFIIRLRSPQIFTFYRRILGDNLVLLDWLGNTVFEGRIEDVGPVPEGILVNALGWYSASDDETSGLIYTSGSGTSVSDIVIDGVDLISDWSALTGNIETTTTDLTALEALDFTGETKVRDMIEYAIVYGNDDAPPRPLQFGIWERRIAKLRTLPDPNSTEAKFIFYTDSKVSKNVSTSLSRKDIYNRIQGLFNDPIVGQDFTAWADDKKSQNEFGTREGSVNIGQGSNGLAVLARDIALEQYAQPKPITTLEFSGAARSIVGERVPLHWVRAGDIVQVMDADPFIASAIALGAQGGQGGAKFTVKQTKYSSSANRLSIEVGERSTAMERMLASIGLSVGGIS